MCVAGKPSGRLLLAAAVSPPRSHEVCLLTTEDSCSGCVFLVDTGTQVFVFPVTSLDTSAPAPSTGPNHLQSVNGSSIRIHHSSDSELHLAGHKFNTHILHAEVDFLLLRAAYLPTSGIAVWSTPVVGIGLPCSSATPSALTGLHPVTWGENPSHNTLEQFPSVTRPTFDTHIPAHGMFHHIKTSGPPVFACPGRLVLDKLRTA